MALVFHYIRSEVYSLKQELRWHVNNGCKVRDPHNGGVITNPDHDSPDSTTTPPTAAARTAPVTMPPNKAYLSECKQAVQNIPKS